MKIAALYARVSTQRQEKEETIESQIAEIKNRIAQDGCFLPPENNFTDDGWSGELIARPALDKLRDAVKRKTFEILYVYDVGRLSRNFMYQLILLDEIKNAGVDVLSLHDINPENEEQGFARNVMGLFHDYERKKIAERMRRGKMYKAEHGLIANCPAAYGYDYVPKNKDVLAHWVINEEEADVVRKIFTWIADEGLTLRGVRKRLQKLGIKPRKGRQTVWMHGPISRLVRNKTYIGVAYYNKCYAVEPKNPINSEQYKRVRKSSRKKRDESEWIKMEVPAILDEELFNRVQDQLRWNKKYSKRNQKAPYLLTHLVLCTCGTRRNGEGVREHRYYRCVDRTHKFPLKSNCKASGVNAFHLDDKVWGKTLDLFCNKKALKKHAEQFMKTQTVNENRTEFEQSKLDQRRKRFDEEENRYLKAYGAGLLSIEQFKDRLEELKQKRELLSSDESKIMESKLPLRIDLTKLESLDQKAREALESFTLDEKSIFLKKVLEQVVVGDGRNVVIKGAFPIGKEAQNVSLWTERRDSWGINKHSLRSSSFAALRTADLEHSVAGLHSV